MDRWVNNFSFSRGIYFGAALEHDNPGNIQCSRNRILGSYKVDPDLHNFVRGTIF